MSFLDIEPARAERWPAIGDISPQRQAVVGRDGVLFPYAGTAAAREQTMAVISATEAYAASVATRHARLSGQGHQLLSIFLPDKVSCLFDLYPTLLPRRLPVQWNLLQQLLAGEPGALFVETVMRASAAEQRPNSMPWTLTGNQLNERGIAGLVETLLARLAVPDVLDLAVTSGEQREWSGELGSAWGRNPLYERSRLTVLGNQREVGRPATAQYVTIMGENQRLREWECPDAVLGSSVLLVGPGAKTSGDAPTDLAWWLARLFRHTYFAPSAGLPDDLGGVQPDVVIMVLTDWMLSHVMDDRATMI